MLPIVVSLDEFHAWRSKMSTLMRIIIKRLQSSFYDEDDESVKYESDFSNSIRIHQAMKMKKTALFNLRACFVLFRGNTSRLQNVLRNILLFNKWFDDLIWFFLDVPGRPVMWINSIKLWTSTNVHYCISTDQILDVLGRAQAVQWTSLDTRFQLDR